MNQDTREQFKGRLAEMIKEASDREKIATDLQMQATTQTELMEMLIKSASSSRRRKGYTDPETLEDQIKRLQEAANKEMRAVNALWEKIHDMQKEERTRWGP
jgi:hypothetical protein